MIRKQLKKTGAICEEMLSKFRVSNPPFQVFFFNLEDTSCKRGVANNRKYDINATSQTDNVEKKVFLFKSMHDHNLPKVFFCCAFGVFWGFF